MERCDRDLAFLLKYENVAWYEDAQVRILDRRIYPCELSYVMCDTHQEVAQAIADMVTQSAGPYTAAGMGMALAAYECRDMKKADQRAYLIKAADTLSHARPTTASRMEQVTSGCLGAADQASARGKKLDEAIFAHTLAALNRRYSTMEKVGG